jgi:hypothetical protein
MQHLVLLRKLPHLMAIVLMLTCDDEALPPAVRMLSLLQTAAAFLN